MKRMGRDYGVAFAAFKGDKTLAELAEQVGVHPTHTGLEAARDGTGHRRVWQHEAHIGHAGCQGSTRQDQATGGGA